MKVQISEDDLQRMLEGNPDLEMEGETQVEAQDAKFYDEGWGEYVPRPITILSYDDYRVQPYALPTPQNRKAGWLRALGTLYPARAWVLLALLAFIFQGHIVEAAVLWGVLVHLTPVLKWSE